LVLVGIGSALVGLAVWRSDKPAVAPLLVVFGAGMILLGAFYARIEGSIEATRDGIKAVVQEVERVAVDRDLSRDDFAELLALALDRYEPPRGKPSEILTAARRAAQGAASDPAESPAALERRLAEATATWLESDGWSVERYEQWRDFGYDMRALKDEEELLVELKAYRHAPISRDVISRAAALRQLAAKRRPRQRTAVVLDANSLAPTQGALEYARQLTVEIYRVDDRGGAETFVGPQLN
jgi:hypothetical protein